jgi:hypothetical protein
LLDQRVILASKFFVYLAHVLPVCPKRHCSFDDGALAIVASVLLGHDSLPFERERKGLSVADSLEVSGAISV